MYRLYRHQLWPVYVTSSGAGACLSWCLLRGPGAMSVASCVMVPSTQIMDRLETGITSHILTQHTNADNKSRRCWEILLRDSDCPPASLRPRCKYQEPLVWRKMLGKWLPCHGRGWRNPFHHFLSSMSRVTWWLSVSWLQHDACYCYHYCRTVIWFGIRCIGTRPLCNRGSHPPDSEVEIMSW